MLAIAFNFLAGRYHATPWGRHVNEADVAWPPDPWRISRSLIAVWHRKLDPSVYPYEQLQRLLAALADAAPPSYQLPKVAIHAHSRHYMPGRGDKRTLVFDAFARIDADEPLTVIWPELDLAPELTALLDALLENLGFLGRAESWVEAARQPQAPPPNCVPGEARFDHNTGEILDEELNLMLPMSPAAYQTLRHERIQAWEIPLSGPKGKPPKLSVEQKRLMKTLPDDWVEAIGVDTGDLQAARWNAPPCAQRMRYRRPLRALRTVAPATPRRLRISTAEPNVNTAVFRLYGRPLPQVRDAIRFGEQARCAANGHVRAWSKTDALPSGLCGHELDPQTPHRHAYWLAGHEVGQKDNGTIQRLVLHLPGGIDDTLRQALMTFNHIKRDEGVLQLVLEGIGAAETLAATTPVLGAGSVWCSRTPYLHPWHMKKRELESAETFQTALLAQLRREWASLGRDPLQLEAIEALDEIRIGGRPMRALSFHRFRDKKSGLTQPDKHGQLLRLRFREPVQGPIALGFGSHFGLGMFVPE